MRRKDREMPKDFAITILDKCQYATMATNNEDSSPYCIPISIVREGEVIYIHCGPEGQKIDNLRRDPRVCISCVGDVAPVPNTFTIEFESALIYGKAIEVLEDEEKIHALDLICRRYTPENMQNFDEAIKASLFRTAVWKIEIETITGKRKKYDSEGVEMKYGRME